MVCATCGSEDVFRDAWAEWDPEGQRWELGTVFDAAFCAKCDNRTLIREKAIRRRRAADENPVSA
jgi:hypothetical protein